MLNHYEYVCSEEKRKDMLRYADAERLAIRARRSALKSGYRRQMLEELSESLIHAGRFVRLLVHAGVPNVDPRQRAQFSGPRI